MEKLCEGFVLSAAAMQKKKTKIVDRSELAEISTLKPRTSPAAVRSTLAPFTSTWTQRGTRPTVISWRRTSKLPVDFQDLGGLLGQQLAEELDPTRARQRTR